MRAVRLKELAMKSTVLIPLADRHAVTPHQFLRAIIRRQSDGKEDKADHEKGAIMNTAANDFAHFLSDDASHGVDWLKKGAQPLGEIWNRDSVSRAQQHHHRLADDATEPEQDRRHDAGKRGRHDDTPNGLKPICS